MIVKFRNHVYSPPFAPYYDKYKLHYFMIDHVSKEDESGEHVWLKCFSDTELLVDGYVHLSDLEEVALTSKKLEDYTEEERKQYTEIFRKYDIF